MDADERHEIEAAKQDPAKFGALYERHFERVYGFVVRRVRDRTVAEDVTADVFHKALAALPGFQVRGAPFAAWLLRIAGNAITDRRRREGHEVAGANDAEPRVQPDESSDQRADLFRFVGDLPTDQRRVIVERFIEERSIKEIANRLDKTEGAVKQLQLRALQRLRTRMEGSHG